MNRDLIELALSAPIDWGRFEELVAEILQHDDLPRLRKLGGGNDLGMDAVEEAFYEDESRVETIVQVTSQRAQVLKFEATVARLRANGITFDRLIVVYRHPVASPTRTEILQRARDHGITVDVRNHHYLVTQLGHSDSGLFHRYFGDVRKQVDILLERQDPLAVLPDRLRHAMLASVGAFVLQPRARLARQTLFEKTVLAALVSSRETTIDELLKAVRKLLPEEEVERERVVVAVESLRRSGECEGGSEKTLRATKSALTSVGAAIAAAAHAYEELRQFVTDSCRRGGRLDEANRGYLERNLRRALLSLFQGYGPIDPCGEPIAIDGEQSRDLLAILAKDLPEGVARSALAAVAGYVERPESWASLAQFVRSYSALAIRNLDPVGRRWQQSVMARTLVVLDTDALLHILIEDLPEQPALVRGCRQMAQSGIAFAISNDVLDEAVGHVSRANRTHRRFACHLSRMSAGMVDGKVWNAVVRGYYFAIQKDPRLGWEKYWARYYDSKDPQGYLCFLLERRLKLKIAALHEIPKGWLADLEIISAALIAEKERHRWKAEFRDEDQMRRRAVADVRMAMHLAVYEEDAPRTPKGYLVSADRAFRAMERHESWAPRPSVLIETHTLPELAEFACGASLSDQDVVKMLFNPVAVAAAGLISDEISDLASLGVDFRGVYMDKLEWDLRTGLNEAVRGFVDARDKSDEERLAGTMNLLRVSRAHGYRLDPEIERVISSYDSAIGDLDSERERRKTAEGAIRQLVRAATGGTKRGKRRVNRILKELGIELERLGEPIAENESAILSGNPDVADR